MCWSNSTANALRGVLSMLGNLSASFNLPTYFIQDSESKAVWQSPSSSATSHSPTVLLGKMLVVFSILLLAQYAVAKVKQSQIGENANPDLSGRVDFYAPRLDITYPGSWGSTPKNPWSLELNVTRDRVEGPNLGSRAPLFTLQVIPPAPGLDGAVYLPNGSYTIGDDDIYAVHPKTSSWSVMMGVVDWTPGLEVPEPNDKQRGSCPESIWTSECVAAMRSAIKVPNEYNQFNASGLSACKGQPDLNFPPFGKCSLVLTRGNPIY